MMIYFVFLILFFDEITCFRLVRNIKSSSTSISKSLSSLSVKKDDLNLDKFFSGFRQLIGVKEPTPVITYEKEIEEARSVLLKASKKEISTSDSDLIVESLLNLEKLMRKQNAADNGITAQKTIKNLNGEWRLVFTTGTVDTQKKIGRINYFPLKAVQSFDTDEFKITNGIFINDYPVIKFFGPFEFNMKMRKLIFDFDQIQVFGIKFDLPKGGAAKIGQTTGLGSENNVEQVNQGKKPFFNWISADDEIATARGGGGGLALWRRIA